MLRAMSVRRIVTVGQQDDIDQDYPLYHYSWRQMLSRLNLLQPPPLQQLDAAVAETYGWPTALANGTCAADASLARCHPTSRATLTTEQVAARFKRTKPEKVRPLLDTLAALSLLRLTDNGYVS